MGAILRALGWAALVLAAVFVLLAAINVPDEDLTPAALALLVPKAVATSPETNGFFLYAGLGAPAAEDAHRWGRERADVLKRAAERRDTRSPEYKKAAADPWPNFPCNHLAAGEKSCLSLVRNRPDAASGWRTRNAASVERYRKLREFENFEDTVDPPPSNLAASLHRAVLMEIVGLAEAGKAPEALRELAQEIALHRRMLAGAHGLDMKMLAANDLAQDYFVLATLLGEQPAVMARTLPEVAELARPLTARELDMSGVMREHYSAIARHMMKPERFADWTPHAEHPLLKGAMPRFFYKPRATTNLLTANVQSMLELTKAPSPELAARDEKLRAQIAARAELCCSPYNPAGRIITDIETPGVYLERIYDLDGLIRLVSLQAQIAAKKVAHADVPAFLAQSPRELTDPFTGKPMQWNGAERQLFFESRQLAGAGWMPKRSGKDKMRMAVRIP